MSVFSGVWLYSAVAFVVGVLLTWLVWVRPLQKRLARAGSEPTASKSETAAPTLFQPGATADEPAPAVTTGTLSGLLSHSDPYGDYSSEFDARPATTDTATSLLEPVSTELRRATYDDHYYSAFARDDVADRFGTLPDDTAGTGRDWEPVQAPDGTEPPEPESEIDRWHEEPAREEATDDDADGTDDTAADTTDDDTTDDDTTAADTDGTDDHAAAYFAHLDREREARGQRDGDEAVPEERAAGEDAVPDHEDDRHEDDQHEAHGDDLFTPARLYTDDPDGEYRDHTDWYQGDRDAEGTQEADPPRIPEIPDVVGDDLTPFDPFSPDAAEYDVPTNGTAELDYLTSPADDDAADDGRDVNDQAGDSAAGNDSDSTAPDDDATLVDAEPVPEPERSLFEPVVQAEPFEDDEEHAEPERPAEYDTELVPAVDQPPESTEKPVPDGPFGPGSALPRVDGGAPSQEFTVKARTSSMVFHTAASPFFERLLPQVWFRTADDAKRAGFTSWERPEK